MQYNTIQYNTMQYNTKQYNTIQYNTIQYNTIQYNTVQYHCIVLYWNYNIIQITWTLLLFRDALTVISSWSFIFISPSYLSLLSTLLSAEVSKRKNKIEWKQKMQRYEKNKLRLIEWKNRSKNISRLNISHYFSFSKATRQ